jgi:hypothetical protein
MRWEFKINNNYESRRAEGMKTKIKSGSKFKILF